MRSMRAVTLSWPRWITRALPTACPTLETDWWNYGGLTRSVSLIEVPEAFIDQYDVHLSRTRKTTVIEGWVHVEGGKRRR